MKKILILTANPKNSDQLRLDDEVRKRQEELQRSHTDAEHPFKDIPQTFVSSMPT